MIESLTPEEYKAFLVVAENDAAISSAAEYELKDNLIKALPGFDADFKKKVIANL